jgi:hypothetical protein
MLSAKDLALVKALVAKKMSPALLKELRRPVNEERRKRRPTVPVGRRSPEGSASHRSQHLLAGGRGPAELTVSGDSSEPAAKRPSPDLGSVQPLELSSRATGEQAAISGRQLVSPRGRGDIRGRSGRNCLPQQPSGPLKPIAKATDPSEPAVSHETAVRRMSLDMSVPMSGMPVGTTTHAQVAKGSAPPQGNAPTRPPFLFQGSTTPGHSWRGCGNPVPGS